MPPRKIMWRRPVTALTITTNTPLPDGTVDASYSTALAATGGTAPYTWAVLSGTLPAGLSLSSGGVLSGTPTTAVVASFTVEVTDALSATASKAFGLTVEEAAEPAGSFLDKIAVTGVISGFDFHLKTATMAFPDANAVPLVYDWVTAAQGGFGYCDTAMAALGEINHGRTNARHDTESIAQAVEAGGVCSYPQLVAGRTPGGNSKWLRLRTPSNSGYNPGGQYWVPFLGLDESTYVGTWIGPGSALGRDIYVQFVTRMNYAQVHTLFLGTRRFVIDLAGTTGSDVVTSASGGFSVGALGVDITGHDCYIATGPNFVVGSYTIAEVISDTSLRLNTSPCPSGNGSLGNFYVSYSNGALAGGWKIMYLNSEPPNTSGSVEEVVLQNSGNLGLVQSYGNYGGDNYGIQDIRGCSFAVIGTVDPDDYTDPPCKRIKSGLPIELTMHFKFNSTGGFSTPGAGSTTLNCATAIFTGSFSTAVYIESGTNFVPGYYAIASINSTTSVELTASPTPSGAGSSGFADVSGTPVNTWEVWQGKELIIQRTDARWRFGPGTTIGKGIGQLAFLPYNTLKYPGQVHDDCYMEFADLIVSKTPIAKEVSLLANYADLTAVGEFQEVAAGDMTGWQTEPVTGHPGDILHGYPLGGGNGDYLTQYQCGWDVNPIDGTVAFQGGAHGTNSPQMMVVLNYRTSAWSYGPYPAGESSNFASHTWDHNTVDPISGRRYFRFQNADRKVYELTDLDSDWVLLPLVPSSSSTGRGSCKFFPDEGTKGMLYWYESSWGIWKIERGPDADPWTSAAWVHVGNGAGQSGGGRPDVTSTDSCWMHYNKINRTMAFGGGNKFWVIDKAGTITAQSDSALFIASDSNSVITVDPKTGKFLIFGDDDVLYERNATTGVETATAVTWPVAFGFVGDGLIFAPDYQNDIILCLKGGNTLGKFWTYRHS